MCDENEAPLVPANVANVDPPRIRITLGENPVVKKKKTYFPWQADQKLYFVKCIKHRNAHMPKKKGQIPVAQAWELVLLDLQAHKTKLFAELGAMDGKVLQNTYNRFAKDVLVQYGVEKDAINLSGLPSKDLYGSLVLEMEEERFTRAGDRKDKTELGKKKRKLLGAMAATVLNTQGGTQSTPINPIEVLDDDEGPASKVPKATPSPLSDGVSAGGATSFITKLAESLKETFGGSGINAQIKLAQLDAAQAQAAYYRSKTAPPRFEAPSGTSSSSNSSSSRSTYGIAAMNRFSDDEEE